MSDDNVLKEYISNLSDEDLKYLDGRLGQRLVGDIAEVLNFLEKTSKIDCILSKTRTADDLYDTVDRVQGLVVVELQGRSRS